MALEDTCSRFAALSDPLRLRMLALMHHEGELCVCELMHALGIPQPKASKHLAILRETGLVRMRREAQWVLYAMAPETRAWLPALLDKTLLAADGEQDISTDRRRLAAMPDRPVLCRSP